MTPSSGASVLIPAFRSIFTICINDRRLLFILPVLLVCIKLTAIFQTQAMLDKRGSKASDKQPKEFSLRQNKIKRWTDY